MRDFYATCAQVLPVLMLAFVFESRFLERLARESRSRKRDVADRTVLVWTKPMVRAYGIFVAAVMLAATGMSVAVLAGVVADSAGMRTAVTAVMLLGLATLLTRVGLDLVEATRERPLRSVGTEGEDDDS